MAHLPTQELRPWEIPLPQKRTPKWDEAKVKAFLTELTALSHKYGIKIGGSDSDEGSPWLYTTEEGLKLFPTDRYCVGRDSLEYLQMAPVIDRTQLPHLIVADTPDQN